MVLNRLLAWCCTFFVMATPAWAATDAAAMAESLMRKSGLWEQLADVAKGVRAGMVAGTGQGARKPSPTELERLSRAIDTAYSAQRLRSACLAAITSELDPKHVRTDWQKHRETGRKFIEARFTGNARARQCAAEGHAQLPSAHAR
jgi:hypothetical protein